MILAIKSVGARIASAAAALLADVEDELRHMREVDQRRIVAGGVAAVALIAVLAGLN